MPARSTGKGNRKMDGVLSVLRSSFFSSFFVLQDWHECKKAISQRMIIDDHSVYTNTQTPTKKKVLELRKGMDDNRLGRKSKKNNRREFRASNKIGRGFFIII